MTRSEVLRNLLKCVFGNYTISYDDDKILRNVSRFQNCNYTPKSYDHFRRLFENIFMNSEPQYTDGTPFDKNLAITNAKKYLSARKIDIPSYLNIDESCKLIYQTLVEKILYAIVVDEQGQSKAKAKNTDINNRLIAAINESRKHIQLYITIKCSESYFDKDSLALEVIDTNYQDEQDKCNCSVLFDCSNMESYRMLMLLRNISVIIPAKSEEEPDRVGDDFTQLSHDLLCGKYSGKREDYVRFPLFFFPDEDYFFSDIKWKTYVNEPGIILTQKASGIPSIIDEYISDIRHRAETQINEYLNGYLTLYYTDAVNKLEQLISTIIKHKSTGLIIGDFNGLNNKTKMKDHLHSLLLKVFWDFELPYIYIENFYKDDICKGLYITLQNIIINITDIMNLNGEEIARVLKNVLPAKRFKEHKQFIRRIITSPKMSKIKEVEKELFSKHPDLFTKPETISDFFYCVRKGTIYNFDSALFKYYGWLNSLK